MTNAAGLVQRAKRRRANVCERAIDGTVGGLHEGFGALLRPPVPALLR